MTNTSKELQAPQQRRKAETFF